MTADHSTDINHVELRGRLMSPPRMLETKRGPLCRLSIATADEWLGPEDTRRCKITHHEVVVWVPALIERIRERGVTNARVHLTGQMITRPDFSHPTRRIREIEINSRCGDIDLVQPVVDTAPAWTGVA
ncbi:hypothetical protein [Fodinicurvata sp. EGI_FJ10296]|uniref:hypothetical protein n=1 Tax=Fodinicurvata sp. EGI_FJ10296 TaxID=3231908 RepID=UPI003453A5FE